MSTRRRHGTSRRRAAHAAQHDASEERWLLTYADMITLLMALFMVLFSITSLNKAKLQVLSKSLQDAFSGRILPGGDSIRDSGANPKASAPPADVPIPAVAPVVGKATASAAKARALQEQDTFRHVKEQV